MMMTMMNYSFFLVRVVYVFGKKMNHFVGEKPTSFCGSFAPKIGLTFN